MLIHDLDNRWSCRGCGEQGPLVATGKAAGMEVMMNMLGSVLAGGASALRGLYQNPADMFSAVSVPGGPDSPCAQAKGLEQRLKGLLRSTSKV